MLSVLITKTTDGASTEWLCDGFSKHPNGDLTVWRDSLPVIVLCDDDYAGGLVYIDNGGQDETVH